MRFLEAAPMPDIDIEGDDTLYTDGTCLYVSTYPLTQPPQKLGYKALLDGAVSQGKTGTFSVMDVKL